MPSHDIAGSSADRPRPSHVLVVEDQPMVRQLVAAFLRAEGIDVSEAPGGDGAVRLLAQGSVQPDLALIDVRLRGEWGVDLAARLKRLAPGLPVVLMSGEDLPDRCGELLGVTFEGFLRKPFKAEQLLAELRRAVRPPA